ncbi:hypothetical protein MMC14_006927 [Varicellaria rhodocarpa]|nr:hypothetical protein [Varicellaria rhodocarpa]
MVQPTPPTELDETRVALEQTHFSAHFKGPHPEEIRAHERTIGPWKEGVSVALCPCACVLCKQQYRSREEQIQFSSYLYVGFHEDKEAASIAGAFAQTIAENLAAVRTILKIHSQLVSKRWRKRPTAKRKALLLRVNPDIYPQQHAFIRLATEFPGEPILARKYRKDLLLPYVNLETLSADANTVLKLLRVRTAYEPAEWVSFDNKQLLPAWEWGALEEKYAFGCVTLHGDEYGKWEVYSQVDMHAARSWGTPRALLILEAQADLSNFLIGFLRQLLVDVTLGEPSKSGSMSADEIAEGAASELGLINWEGSSSSLSMLYYEEPFSAPPNFNLRTINRLIEVAEDKLAEAQDHLCFLQSDPGYFYSNMVYDKDQWKGTSFSKEKQRYLLADRALHMPTGDALIWQHIVEECRNVRHEFLNHQEHVHVGQSLPKRYGQALGSLHLLLSHALSRKSRNVGELVYVSPACKENWVLHRNSRKELELRTKTGKRATWAELAKQDPIYFCFLVLDQESQAPVSLDFANLLLFLDDHLSKCSRSEAAKIDQISYHRLSDLAALHKLLDVVRMHLPAVEPMASTEHALRFRNTPAWRLHDNKQIAAAMGDSRQAGVGTILDNLERFRIHTGRRDLSWLNHTDAARRELSLVWKFIKDKTINVWKSCGIEESTLVDLRKLMSYSQSPEHREYLDRERTQILGRLNRPSKKAMKDLGNVVHRPSAPAMEHLASGSKPTTTKSMLLQTPKEKVKTRPDVPPAPPAEPEIPAVVNEREEDVNVPSYFLKKRKSERVVSLLFPEASEDVQGSLSWEDFKGFMADIGFSAVHRGGSEWTFKTGEPAGGRGGETVNNDATIAVGVKRSIVIHQPHPEPKMNAILLQRIGRRFSRRFGWERGDFAMEVDELS